MFRYLRVVLWYRVDLCEKVVVRGWEVSIIKPRNYIPVLLEWGSGVSLCVLRVCCFLSLCHLGGSCLGGRALWSSPVGDGEKWQVREKASIYICGAEGRHFLCVGWGVRGWVWMWESYGTYVYAVFSLSVCFFLVRLYGSEVLRDAPKLVAIRCSVRREVKLCVKAFKTRKKWRYICTWPEMTLLVFKVQKLKIRARVVKSSV